MRAKMADSVGGLTRLWSRQERLVQVLVLAAGVAFVIAAVALGRTVSVLKMAGYPGVAFLSFLGSAAIVLPVPGLISLCGVSVVLNPFVLGLIAGIAESLGEFTGYAIGYGSHGVIEKRAFYRKIQTWMESRGALIIFLASVIPNPVFDLVGITAGGTRYPLVRFFVVVWAGKTLKGLMIAYSCYHGIKLLPWID